MKKAYRPRIRYSIALATMATTLAGLQAYASDDIQPMVQETRPPQVAPAANLDAPMPQMSAPAHILGTLNTNETPPASLVVPPATTVSSVPVVANTAAIPDGTLQAKQAGDVTYITGGIGDEERATLDAVKKDYNVHIMVANKDGSFVGDTEISIHDHKGNVVLTAAAGPLFYAKLPPGAYTIESSNDGKNQIQKTIVNARTPSNLHFSW